MRMTASTCRAQQVIQQKIAENDPLENRRSIAKAAATAWGNEAIEADKRDLREQKRKAEIALQAETAMAAPV